MARPMMSPMTPTQTRQPRTQISLALPPKILDMLDQQAATLGISRPRYIARLVQDRQQVLDMEHDITLLKATGPDPDMGALADWVAAHPVDLGP